MSTDNASQGSFWRNADAMMQTAKAREQLFSQPALKMVQMSGIADAIGPLKVLDNGSGDGIVAQQVWDSLSEESRKNLELVCGDLSLAMVHLAAKRIERGNWPAAKAVVMDMQGFAVQFAPKHDVAFNEIKRVCQGGAVIGLTTWKQFGWAEHVRKSLARLPGCPLFPEDDVIHSKLHWGNPWYSDKFVDSKLKEHGFADVRIEESVAKHTIPVPVFAATGGMMVKPMLALFWDEDAVQRFGKEVEGALLKYFGEEGVHEVTFTNVALVAVARTPTK